MEIETLDKETAFLAKNTTIELKPADSLGIMKQLQEILLELHGQAYLEASFDEISKLDSSYRARLYVGEPYYWANLENGNVEKSFLERIGFRERLYSAKPFNYIEVRELQESLLKYAENNGYPFASVRLDSIRIDNGRISARLYMRKGRLITLDGINVKGELKIAEGYLKNYLGLKDGAVYNHKRILGIRQRIRELPFLEEAANVTVSFTGSKATVNLYLTKKNSSRWDVLLGILPGDGQSGKARFTGSATLDFYNQLGFGERLYMDFQRLRPGTQEIELKVNYPYILTIPFGVDFNFSQYRRDSTYNDVSFDTGIQYLFSGRSYLKAFWKNHNSALLEIDEQALLRLRRLPDNLDINRSNFGLEYFQEQLDYNRNPRRGWSGLIRGAAGFKTIEPNNTIQALSDVEDPSFRFDKLYDSLELRTFQYSIESNLEAFLPLFQRSTLKAGVRSGWLITEQAVYQNEQFRIGGNRILRGFAEQSVFATRFAVFTLEYRLLIDQNSFLFLFSDYAYVEDITATQRNFEHPLGFGGGLSFFADKVGLISLSLAWGKEGQAALRFNDAKIHLGYKSFF